VRIIIGHLAVSFCSYLCEELSEAVLQFLVLFDSVGCSHLEVLCISWCHLVTDDGIECLARRANRLRTFMCKGATQVFEICLS